MALGWVKWCMVAFFVLVLGGCAQHGYRSTEALAVGQCDSMWQAYQQRISEGSVFDAQDWPLPDYPFLRVSRSSSYVTRMELSGEQRAEWLRQAYEKGRKARAIENGKLALPMSLRPLENCLREAVPTLVDDDAFWEYVRQHPRPDAYNDLARVLGLYPLVQPIVSWRVDVLIDETEDAFQRYEGESPWRRYAADNKRPDWDRVQEVLDKDQHQDVLGLPAFNDTELNTLFDYYAPVIELESGHPDDRIGRPHKRDGSWTTRPAPEVFTQQSQILWQGEWLPQLVYTWWYPSRPKDHALDMYGGELDGLVFRLTLDWDGKVLFYDSIHPCGCYHKWHPAQADIEFKGNAAWDEPLAVLPVDPPAQPYQAVVRLQSKTHYLVGLDFEETQADSPNDTYALLPQTELRREALGESFLFAPDGLVKGSERLERFLFWNLGIPSAGAMRQWGHHAVAFVGRRHFDDPDLFERYFRWESPE